MRGLMVALLVTVAFAGCTDADPDGAQVVEPELAPRYPVSGLVTDENFRPVEGATVTLTNPEFVYVDGTVGPEVPLEATTNHNGEFSFESYSGNYPITVQHPDLPSASGTVSVAAEKVEIALTMAASLQELQVPYTDSFDFDGEIECAVEALIITPSCDTLLQDYAEDQAPFTDDSVFEITTPQGWQTLVLDIRFDPSGHDGIAGLRTSAYAADADAEVFEYERITQAYADGDFSLRIDAGQDYGDYVLAPDSDGGDGLRFEFYPHGHGDDTACVPEEAPEVDPRAAPGVCFLGVGATQDLTFTAKATMFVHEPAPEGWTTLGQQ